MKGTCALTFKETELRHSHIYPKFIIEWMKLTGSKYTRGYTAPNKRLQDGYKVYLLSEEAEQLFSKREKWFSENIFHNYLNNVFAELNYDENLFYFAISFLWRILILELRQSNIEEFKFYSLMKETEFQWRNFLYRGYYPKNFDRIHLILMDSPIDHTMPSGNVDFFLTRSLDGTTAFNERFNKCSIFAKFSKFIFWAFLTEDETGMKGTKINPIKGIMKFPQKFDNGDVTSFFSHRIQLYDKMEYPSENQQEKIAQEILNNREHYSKSELLDSMEFDYYMKEKNKNNRW
jgi:hypothetical protein